MKSSFTVHFKGHVKQIPVCQWQTGDTIPKGRRANPQFLNKCRRIQDLYLCYYWATGDEVLYVGSATDYKNRGSKDTNLVMRVANYLGNHQEKNTNFRIFTEANKHLQRASLEFGIFRFNECMFGGEKLDHQKCSSYSQLVLTVEQLLIAHYKQLGQCRWNK